MFEVGFSELLVIFGLALIVLGPEKLPRLVSKLGHWVGRARVMARQFRDQLELEAHHIEAAAEPPPAPVPTPSPTPKPDETTHERSA